MLNSVPDFVPPGDWHRCGPPAGYVAFDSSRVIDLVLLGGNKDTGVEEEKGNDSD